MPKPNDWHPFSSQNTNNPGPTVPPRDTTGQKSQPSRPAHQNRPAPAVLSGAYEWTRKQLPARFLSFFLTLRITDLYRLEIVKTRVRRFVFKNTKQRQFENRANTLRVSSKVA